MSYFDDETTFLYLDGLVVIMRWLTSAVLAFLLGACTGSGCSEQESSNHAKSESALSTETFDVHSAEDGFSFSAKVDSLDMSFSRDDSKVRLAIVSYTTSDACDELDVDARFLPDDCLCVRYNDISIIGSSASCEYHTRLSCLGGVEDIQEIDSAHCKKVFGLHRPMLQKIYDSGSRDSSANLYRFDAVMAAPKVDRETLCEHIVLDDNLAAISRGAFTNVGSYDGKELSEPVFDGCSAVQTYDKNRRTICSITHSFDPLKGAWSQVSEPVCKRK